MPVAREQGTKLAHEPGQPRHGLRRAACTTVLILLPTGTPIYAADSGVITMAQWYGVAENGS